MGLGGSGDAVGAPQGQLAINAGEVGVVGEDDGHTDGAGGRRELGRLLDGRQEHRLERASRGIAQLVDDEQRALRAIDGSEVDEVVVVLVAEHGCSFLANGSSDSRPVSPCALPEARSAAPFAAAASRRP